MRLATYNVENMFQRPKAMNLETWKMGAGILEDFMKLNELVLRDVYTASVKTAMLKIMERHRGLATRGESTYILLRAIRGKLIGKPRNKPLTIIANGRSDWIGWFELKTERITEKAIENTGRIIGLLETDVLCVIEAEDRICLKRFNNDVLPNVQASPFKHVMLVDGNDSRGIDVGIMTKPSYPITAMRSHIDDVDDTGIIFSRDCIEYAITTELGNTLLVLVNHFKSKGYGSPAQSSAKRLRQSQRVREIYEERIAEGVDYIAIVGDLNAVPDEPAMDPLIRNGSKLIDIMVHPKFTGDDRPGTFGNGTASAKLDYILLSPKLSQQVAKGGIERRGVWGGKNGTLFPHIPTIETEKDAASDHAALWVELTI